MSLRTPVNSLIPTKTTVRGVLVYFECRENSGVVSPKLPAAKWLSRVRIAVGLLAIAVTINRGDCQPGTEARPDVSRLIDLVVRGNITEGKEAGRALIAMGPDAVPGLIAALHIDIKEARFAPAAVLAQIGDAAIPAIIQAMQPTNPEMVRANAAYALDRDAVGLQALSDLNIARAVASLTQALGDPSAAVRTAALSALRSYHQRAAGAVCKVVELLDDRSADVREQSTWAIGDIGIPTCGAPERLIATFAKEPDLRGLAHGPCKASSSLASLGPSIIPRLNSELSQGKTARARACAADVIGELKSASGTVVETLAGALDHDPNPLVAEHAANALDSIGADAHDAVPALTRALTNRDDMVRSAALQAFGSMGEYAVEAIPLILQKARSTDYGDVRNAATTTLQRLATGARPAGRLAETLDRIAITPLDGLLEDRDNNIRHAAFEALGHIEKEPETTLVSKLADPDPQWRLAAVRALALIFERMLEGRIDSISDAELAEAIRTNDHALDAAKTLVPRDAIDPVGRLSRTLTGLRREESRRQSTRGQLRSNLIGGSSLMLGVGTLVLLGSVRARRNLMILLGRRWRFVTTECDYAVAVRSFSHEIRVELKVENLAEPAEYVGETAADLWPPDIGNLTEMIDPHSDVRVRVDEEVFFQPWSQFLGGKWSNGRQATIAGQIATIAPVHARLPFPAKRIRVSVLTCPEPGRGFAPLHNLAIEALNVQTIFEEWGAEVSQTASALAVDFLQALQTSDIVHVAAHATPSSVEFLDRAATAADLAAHALADVRCRFLVLSACEAGQVGREASSLVFELIRAGVNTVAANAPVDTVVCKAFLEEMYAAMLPRRRGEGTSIADAIRTASSCCEIRFGAFSHQDWTTTVNAFILYGDPTLRLVFTNRSKAVMDDHLQINAPENQLATNRR
jgi:HEAT repeat protein